MSSMSDHSKGLLLTAIGGLVLTVDIPLIKLANGDSWSILLLRSGTTFIAAILFWTVWRLLSPRAPVLIPGRAGLMVAALYGLSSIAFLMAVFNTSTANLVFILAFTSMFAALLSWVFLKERPKTVTLVAMAVMICGVAIIVGDGISAGNLFGNALALLASFLLASAITVTRASGRDMGLTALVAVALPFTVSVVMVSKVGFHVEAPWWIIFNGAIIMPVSFYCLATGPRYITGPEVAMFYLLETVLAPVWVWMIFAEVPSRASMTGGMILVMALVGHSVWQLAEGRRRRAALAVRQPA